MVNNPIKIENILKEIKLGNSFSTFGGLGLLLSIYLNHLIGLKISLLLLIFGGLFRLLNIVSKAMSELTKNISYNEYIKWVLGKFIMFLTPLIIFLYLINKIVPII